MTSSIIQKQIYRYWGDNWVDKVSRDWNLIPSTHVKCQARWHILVIPPLERQKEVWLPAQPGQPLWEAPDPGRRLCSITHNSWGCVHKTCTRSSQSNPSIDGGGADETPILYGELWSLLGKKEYIFFKDVGPERPCPSRWSYTQAYTNGLKKACTKWTQLCIKFFKEEKA